MIYFHTPEDPPIEDTLTIFAVSGGNIHDASGKLRHVADFLVLHDLVQDYRGEVALTIGEKVPVWQAVVLTARLMEMCRKFRMDLPQGSMKMWLPGHAPVELDGPGAIHFAQSMMAEGLPPQVCGHPAIVARTFSPMATVGSSSIVFWEDGEDGPSNPVAVFAGKGRTALQGTHF